MCNAKSRPVLWYLSHFSIVSVFISMNGDDSVQWSNFQLYIASTLTDCLVLLCFASISRKFSIIGISGRWRRFETHSNYPLRGLGDCYMDIDEYDLTNLGGYYINVYIAQVWAGFFMDHGFKSVKKNFMPLPITSNFLFKFFPTLL